MKTQFSSSSLSEEAITWPIEQNEFRRRGLLFRGDMIRALLNTKVGVWPAKPIDPTKPWKWQTRRMMKPQPVRHDAYQSPDMPEPQGVWTWSPNPKKPDNCWYAWDQSLHPKEFNFAIGSDCPLGYLGDQIWAKETFAPMPHLNAGAYFRATDPLVGVSKWTPSIFMPESLSRLEFEIMNTRAHRIREITYGDALAEGIPLRSGFWYADGKPKLTSEIDDYLDLFKEINGPESTEKNCWVWCLELRRIK